MIQLMTRLVLSCRPFRVLDLVTVTRGVGEEESRIPPEAAIEIPGIINLLNI